MKQTLLESDAHPTERIQKDSAREVIRESVVSLSWFHVLTYEK